MNVKVPTPPINYSKAAVSTRQESSFQAASSKRTAGSSTTNQLSPRKTGGLPLQSRGNTAIEMSLKADLASTTNQLLDITTQQDSQSSSKLPAGVNEDCGREREMCSSPRLHNAVQHRMQQVQLANQRYDFVNRIVTERVGEKIRTITPSLEQPRLEEVELLLVTQSEMNHPPEGGDRTQQQLMRPATSGRSPRSQSGGQARPSSCFVSRAQRFTSSSALAPPVGHYNTRFGMVDRNARAARIAKGEYQAKKGSPTAADARASSPSQDYPLPLQSEKSQQKKSQDNPSEKTQSEGDRHEKKSTASPPQKPTSAFASKVPQLKSLKPQESYYRDDIPPESGSTGTGRLLTYNESCVRSSPRGIVAMSRTTPRNKVSSDDEGNRSEVSRSPRVTSAKGTGTPYEGQSSATSRNSRPSSSGVDFGRQVGRGQHTVHGQRYSAFCDAESVIEGHRATGLRDNDPGRDGTSIDYVADPRQISSAKVKGAVAFGRQISRKPLHHAQQVVGRREVDTYEAYEEDLHMGAAHGVAAGNEKKNVISFEKMHCPEIRLKKSDCAVEVYDTDPADFDQPVVSSRVPGFNMSKQGSHDDTGSVFSAANTKSHKGAGGEYVTIRDRITHPKLSRDIDLSKLPPRSAGGGGTALTARAPKPKSTVAVFSPPKRMGRRVFDVEADKKTSYSNSDKDIVRSRVTGNPFISKHLSRNARSKVLEYRPIATSDRNYDSHLGTVAADAQEKIKLTSRLSFDKQVSREHKLGSRLGAEYSDKDTPGPGEYDPNIKGVFSASPPRR